MKIKRNEPLSRHTTFGLGGNAALFIEPAGEKALRQALAMARKRKLPVRVIGAGSNILCADRLRPAAVISLSGRTFKALRFGRGTVRAGAGCLLARLLASCLSRGVSNLEPLAGIPGTVGGAVVMNAGIIEGGRHRSIADYIESVKVMDYNGTVKILTSREVRFSYRSSDLKDLIVLSADLKVRTSTPERVRQRLKKYLRARAHQEYAFPNAGCVFKNPARASAGRLIDECGLKGRRIGSAFVSSKHANFICSSPGGRAQDVLRLMRLLQRTVRNKKGILLEPEIKIWR